MGPVANAVPNITVEILADWKFAVVMVAPAIVTIVPVWKHTRVMVMM